MRKYLLLISIFLFLPLFSVLKSQSGLYMPLNIKRAYEKGTRSYDGNPGKHYWQNGSIYKINVSVNPATRLVDGKEKIIYKNNSPDTLNEIVIRLYQDIFRQEAARSFGFDKELITNGVDVKSVFINDKEIDINNNDLANRYKTNLFIKLVPPLKPNSELVLEAEWSFTIPGSGMRMGTYDSTTFVIGQWYPQIAVYDDIDRWDKTGYTGLVEFYNDFCDFDVEISVPNNFFVWGTGVLQNPERIYCESVYGKYKQALNSDSVIRIVNPDDLKNGHLLNETKEFNVWNFKAENVTDFVFAMSDHHLWDAVSYMTQDGRNVFISSAYNPNSNDFKEVTEIARQVIKMLSEEFPAVPFPYPVMTVFNGGGGMEYPMMVNDGSAEYRFITVHLTSHEISHTYFPFYMGTNEKKYAFMDEGWAVMLPAYIQKKLSPDYEPFLRPLNAYLNYAGTEWDQPPMIPSVLLGENSSYRNASYNRPAFAYEFLRDALGEEIFDNALREYMKRWNGKHPLPYDFFYSFENSTGENLDWFWKPWFFEKSYPDLAIKDVKSKNGMVKVLVQNKGGMPLPVKLTYHYGNNNQGVKKVGTRVWKDKNEVWIEISSNKKIRKIILGGDYIPDVNNEDNKFIF